MSEKSKTHAGHRQRMKMRFKNDSLLSTFSEHEVLEMALFYCYSRMNTNELAHKLIDRFGSIYGVFSASEEELRDSGLLGENPAFNLKFFFAMSDYLQKNYAETAKRDSDYDEAKYIGNAFIGLQADTVMIFFIDSARKIKKQAVVAVGKFETVAEDLRKITKIVLNSGYDYIIFAHNHADGVSGAPTHDEIYATLRVKKFLEGLNVTLVDHYVVSHNHAVSMSNLGLFEIRYH